MPAAPPLHPWRQRCDRCAIHLESCGPRRNGGDQRSSHACVLPRRHRGQRAVEAQPLPAIRNKHGLAILVHAKERVRIRGGSRPWPRLARQFNPNDQAAIRCVGGGYLAAVESDSLFGNRQTQPGSAGLAITRLTDAVERFENALQRCVGHTGTMVADLRQARAEVSSVSRRNETSTSVPSAVCRTAFRITFSRALRSSAADPWTLDSSHWNTRTRRLWPAASKSASAATSCTNWFKATAVRSGFCSLPSRRASTSN